MYQSTIVLHLFTRQAETMGELLHFLIWKVLTMMHIHMLREIEGTCQKNILMGKKCKVMHNNELEFNVEYQGIVVLDNSVPK